MEDDGGLFLPKRPNVKFCKVQRRKRERPAIWQAFGKICAHDSIGQLNFTSRIS